jgi:hypothetical protein
MRKQNVREMRQGKRARSNGLSDQKTPDPVTAMQRRENVRKLIVVANASGGALEPWVEIVDRSYLPRSNTPAHDLLLKEFRAALKRNTKLKWLAPKLTTTSFHNIAEVWIAITEAQVVVNDVIAANDCKDPMQRSRELSKWEPDFDVRELARLRRCGRARCARAYIASRKDQKWCSARCGASIRQRRFRASHTG